jgi:predicted DNA-binding protein
MQKVCRKNRKSVPLPPQLEEDLRLLVYYTGRTESELAREAISQYVQVQLKIHLDKEELKTSLRLLQEGLPGEDAPNPV